MTQPIKQWQFTAQPQSDWPTWVKGDLVGIDLRHEHRSGRQIVRFGEYLYLDQDGTVYGSGTGLASGRVR